MDSSARGQRRGCRKSKQLGLSRTRSNDLGLKLTEKNKLDQAELYFKKAIEINNTSSMCYSALGYLYYLRRQYETAIQDFRRALQLDPNNAGAHNNLGYTLSEIGVNLNEAVRECRKAVMLNANSAAYHDSLGWALFVSGDFAESAKELRRALELAPPSVIQEH
jgi:tetratricopeptide (TPR) repeat protein